MKMVLGPVGNAQGESTEVIDDSWPWWGVVYCEGY